MKKILVNKSDEVAVIVEKIIDTHDNEVVLSVPKFSHLGESLSNFHLLKREASALEKKIMIESVDDHIIELAEMSGLTALNPFFAKNKRQFADILGPKSPKARKKKLLERTVEDRFSALEEDFDRPLVQAPKRRRIPTFSLPEFNRNFFIIGSGLIAVVAVVFVGIKILPRAKVNIIPQTLEWQYNDSIITDRSAVVDAAKMAIPNQIFYQKKNVQLKFPATGKKQIEKKAIGVITVYNSYSSDPQPLIEQTRFAAPDGKIFRLIKNVIVPGAKITEGKIISSSIDVNVVADAAGAEYNIGPVKLFNIPGFIKGSPKYQAFYGESKKEMSGGFIGEVAYPNANDIKIAKDKAKSALEDSLATMLFSQIPKEFKILEGAKKLELLQQKVDEEADKEESFGIFAEIQLTVIGFKDEDLKMLLASRAKRDNGDDFDIRTSELNYGLVRADFSKGVLSFPVNFKAVLARHIDGDALKSKIAGKSEIDLKATVFGLSGLKSATISLWPFWVKRVPNDLNKISILVE